MTTAKKTGFSKNKTESLIGLKIEKIKHYYNNYFFEHFNLLKNQPSYRKWMKAEEKKLLKLVPKNAKVLEIGAGFGRIIDLLNNNKRKIMGIDLCNITYLKKKYYNNPNIKILRMNAEKLKFRQNTFDICTIMSNTLGLFLIPSKVLKECYRVTKPDGRIIISLYESNSNYVIKERMKFFTKAGYKVKLDNNQLKVNNKGVSAYYFTKTELKNIFKENRLKFIYYPLTRLGCLWVSKKMAR